MRTAISEALLVVGVTGVALAFSLTALVLYLNSELPIGPDGWSFVFWWAGPGFAAWTLVMVVGYTSAHRLTSSERARWGIALTGLGAGLNALGICVILAAEASMSASMFAGLWVLYYLGPAIVESLVLFGFGALACQFVRRFLVD